MLKNERRDGDRPPKKSSVQAPEFPANALETTSRLGDPGVFSVLTGTLLVVSAMTAPSITA